MKFGEQAPDLIVFKKERGAWFSGGGLLPAPVKYQAIRDGDWAGSWVIKPPPGFGVINSRLKVHQKPPVATVALGCTKL